MSKQGGQIFVFILALAIAGFFYGQTARASQSILINEIMYDLAKADCLTDGTDPNHEWIELYNNSGETVALSGGSRGWRFNDGSSHYLDEPPTQWLMTISPGGYAILTASSTIFFQDHPNFQGTIIDTAMSLKNTSATVSIIRPDGNKVDEIIYQSSWGAKHNCKTLERKNDGSFAESLISGGTPGALNSVLSPLSPPPTAQCGNGQVEAGEQCDDGNLTGGDGCSSICQAETPAPTPAPDETASTTDQTPPLNLPLGKGENNQYNFGEVVINEFVSDPADNEVEWIELYNKTSQEIDLTGWWLEDGSKTKTKLAGMIGAGGSVRYKIVEKPAGVLNNEGDLIILYDGGGKIIDQTAYGNWNDGNQEDNAPVAHDPASVARKFDGYNTFNNANDFAVTLKPTKGASNIIQAEDEASAEAKAKFDFSQDIFISEILPNPTGDDAKLEFIEIYNADARDVNLTGWSLSNEDSKKKNLESIATSAIIKAGAYLAAYRTKTKIVLHNDLGQVKLFQPLADKPLMAVAYKNVKEGYSYNANAANYYANAANNNPPSPLYQGGKSSGEWTWSETPTPGAMNIFKTVNQAPAVGFSFKSPVVASVPVIFDSSDTDDLDGDILKYAWDFGDGFKNNLANPEHTFLKSGIYKIKLAAGDGQATTTAEKNLKVGAGVNEFGVNEETPLSPPLSGGRDNPPSPLYQGGTVIINEIFPNPAGADTGGEWAELKNQGLDKVNLINWRVENSNGKYKFKDNLWLDAKNFYLLAGAESQLAFKNKSDVISLYNDFDELIDRVEYRQAVQGEAYARGENGKWFWTTKITPGQENVISLANSQSLAAAKGSVAADNIDNYMVTDLEKIRELEIGSLVKVKGTVAVEPGILGAQIFYIVGSPTQASSSAVVLPEADFFAAALADKEVSAGKPGIQIYNYKKDFPALKVGDYIEVNGELAQTQDEFRIKTKDKNDINLVEHKPAPPALSLSGDALSEENIGQLITITGEITDKKASTAYLDDGNDEVLVYFKKSAGLDVKNLKVGQAVAMTGILSKTPTGLRLLPRYQADIVKIDEASSAPQVLGETASSQEWAVAERDKKLELFKYLLIIAGGVIIVLAGLFVRIKRK